MTITKNQVVSLHYTLKNDDGDIIDSSEGLPTLDFIYGMGAVIKGLEKALANKQVGDSFNVSIPPEDAYGFERIENIQSIPLSQFEDPSSIQPGVQFQLDNGALAVVQSVSKESVTLDMNHPLAGQTLHFDISIENLRDASEKEISDGKIHGPDADCGCC